MLDDPRSSSLTANFAGQWLYLRNLQTIAPNGTLFPTFDDNLREAFRRETELFFDSQVRADRSVLELLSADYTFLNDRLARHYGIAGVYGSHYRRVAYPDDRRAGLLGHGSILTVTSHPNRTSPVVRGKWLLENLLGSPPPPPPPDIPALVENDEGTEPANRAGTAGAAPRQPDLRRVPRQDGPARLRPRELRRRRRARCRTARCSRSRPSSGRGCWPIRGPRSSSPR